MRDLIIDTSVVLKWFPVSKEQGMARARSIYRMMVKGELRLLAPTFLLVEVANVLVRKKKVERLKVEKFVKRLKSCGIGFVDVDGKVESLLKIIFSYEVSAYDGLYLLLAKQEGCRLVSADEKLLRIQELTVGIEEIVESYPPLPVHM
ncbi:MAG: type II toxin-antitoxin system VapC family toxin [bacterium]|nr:type II toxin-antitoxin system VapC family toxin [bacterium]